MTTFLEVLRPWSSALMWIGIVAPILGALVGAAAGVTHFYVNRSESQLTAAAYGKRFEDQEKELESSRAALQSLEAATARRTLPAPAAAELTRALSKIRVDSVVLITRMLDVECSTYAKQIGAAFQAANWKVDYNSSSLNDHTGTVVGFRIGDDPGILEAKDPVIDALRQAGIAVSGGPIRENSFSGEIPLDSLVLWVGRRGPDLPLEKEKPEQR